MDNQTEQYVNKWMDKEDFYQSGKWKRKRERILRRDKYTCQICKRYGRIREATIVHHKIEYEDDPSLGLVDSNLVSVCKSCHEMLHPEKGTKSNRLKAHKRGNYNDPYGG